MAAVRRYRRHLRLKAEAEWEQRPQRAVNGTASQHLPSDRRPLCPVAVGGHAPARIQSLPEVHLLAWAAARFVLRSCPLTWCVNSCTGHFVGSRSLLMCIDDVTSSKMRADIRVQQFAAHLQRQPIASPVVWACGGACQCDQHLCIGRGALSKVECCLAVITGIDSQGEGSLHFAGQSHATNTCVSPRRARQEPFARRARRPVSNSVASPPPCASADACRLSAATNASALQLGR